MDLNNISLTGRLTRDAERKVFPSSGAVYAQFSIANNTGFGQYAKVNYFDCKMIGKGAEAVLPYLTKGQLVGITGQLEVNEYTRNDGTLHKGWQLTASTVNLLGGRTKNPNDPVNDPDPADQEGIMF